MHRSFEVKELARKVGMDVPTNLSESDTLSYIANQVGLQDFNNSEDDIEILYNTLKDVDNQNSVQQLNNQSNDNILDQGSGYDSGIADSYSNNVNEFSSNNKVNSPKNINKSNESDANSNLNKGNENSNQVGGNGYGAIRNGAIRNRNNDDTRNATKNLQHGRRMAQGESENNNIGTKASGLGNKLLGKGSNNSSGNKDGGKDSKSSSNSLGGQKNKVSNPISKIGAAKNIAANPFDAVKKQVRNKILLFLATNPVFWIIIIFLLLFLIILFVVLSSESSSGSGGTSSRVSTGANCSYNLNGVGDLENINVELVNCDATPGNYHIIETIDLEKYSLGVALAEIGESTSDEGIKAQIIAARNFALTRSQGMGNSTFYGYDPSSNVIRMRACEADQVYWDYEKDSYRIDRGRISLYSPEVSSGAIWKRALSAERIQQVEALSEDVRGKVLVDSNNNPILTGYKSSDSTQMIDLARQGKSYEEILQAKYGSSTFYSASCTSYEREGGVGGGNIDYGDYILSTDNAQMINQSLPSFLSSHGTSIEEFNSLIASNVKEAGYGTKAGVAAAAVTLIAELSNNYNTKLAYFYGGGHDGSAIYNGANPNWGAYPNSIDCSAFVSWAIYNGGFNMNIQVSGSFSSLPGAQSVGLDPSRAVLEPGDLLHKPGHIALVVAADEQTKTYVTAEAMGTAYGIVFGRVSFSGDRFTDGVIMDNYYANNVRG